MIRVIAIGLLVGGLAAPSGILESTALARARAHRVPTAKKVRPRKPAPRIAMRSPLPTEVEEVILPRDPEPVVVQEIPLLSEIDALPEVSKILKKDAALKPTLPYTPAPRVFFKAPPPLPKPESPSFLASLFEPVPHLPPTGLSAPPRRLVSEASLLPPLDALDWIDALFALIFLAALARTFVLMARMYLHEP